MLAMLPSPDLPPPCQPGKVPAAVPYAPHDAGKVQPDAGSHPPAVASPPGQWWQHLTWPWPGMTEPDPLPQLPQSSTPVTPEVSGPTLPSQLEEAIVQHLVFAAVNERVWRDRQR